MNGSVWLGRWEGEQAGCTERRCEWNAINTRSVGWWPSTSLLHWVLKEIVAWRRWGWGWELGWGKTGEVSPQSSGHNGLVGPM